MTAEPTPSVLVRSGAASQGPTSLPSRGLTLAMLAGIGNVALLLWAVLAIAFRLTFGKQLDEAPLVFRLSETLPGLIGVVFVALLGLAVLPVLRGLIRTQFLAWRLGASGAATPSANKARAFDRAMSRGDYVAIADHIDLVTATNTVGRRAWETDDPGWQAAAIRNVDLATRRYRQERLMNVAYMAAVLLGIGVTLALAMSTLAFGVSVLLIYATALVMFPFMVGAGLRSMKIWIDWYRTDCDRPRAAGDARAP